MVENESYKIKTSSCLVVSVLCYREYLPVVFYLQQELFLYVLAYLLEQLVQFVLCFSQYDHVVGISEIIPHSLMFLDPMIEVCKVKIGEVLG